MNDQYLTIQSNNSNNYNSKSLPPSPVLSTREQFNLTSRSQHSSPCIVSQQQAKEMLNSLNLKQQQQQQRQQVDKLSIIKQQKLYEDSSVDLVESSIVEINDINKPNNVITTTSPTNNNIITLNSSKIINKVIERNKQSLSPLIISENNGSNSFNNNGNNGNYINNNQTLDIEMSTINTLTESNNNINNNNSNNSDIISDNGADISTSNNNVNGNNVDQQNETNNISVEQRIREERLNVLRIRIQNETLFKNYTKLNTAYGLAGMLTVFSTVFLFVKGFEKNPDNHILYVGIALSTLGFIVINHSIHIAYRRSRRNIDTLQQEFMRVYESNENNVNNSNVDPSTIPSKLETCTIDIHSSPNFEKPPSTPKINGFSPIFNKIVTSPIFNKITTSPKFNQQNQHQHQQNDQNKEINKEIDNNMNNNNNNNNINSNNDSNLNKSNLNI